MTTPKDDELPQSIAELFDRLAEPFHTELMEQSARLSAQRYLLEMLYAQQFLNQPEAFEEFMEGAIDMARTSSRRTEPLSEDVALELQARVATQLQRFRESVVQRLEQGLGE